MFLYHIIILSVLVVLCSCLSEPFGLNLGKRFLYNQQYANTSEESAHQDSDHLRIKNLTTSIMMKNSTIQKDFLFVVTLHSEQIPIFSHWLSWARVAGLFKFLVFAMDEKSAAKSHSLELQTFCPQSLYRLSYSDKISFRHDFFVALLTEGVSFISVEPNTFILDMSSFSLPEKGIYLCARTLSAVNTNERVKLHPELFGVSTTTGAKGLAFMQRLAGCYFNGTMSKRHIRRSLEPSLYSAHAAAVLHYQSCMEKTIADSAHKDNKILRGKILQSIFYFFDYDVVGTVRQLFKLNIPQSKGALPAVLLMDEPVDAAALDKLLRDWNLDLSTETLNHPKVQHAPYASHWSIATKPVASVVQKKKIALTIRIITMDRPVSLQRLLTSLQNAHYDKDAVNIQIYVDKPNCTVDQTEYSRVVDIVNAFEWKHGSVHRHFEPQNAGIFKMWVRPFPVKSNSSATQPYLMVLEDDVEVSPVFYAWAKKVLLAYGPYGEGNLYGFTIERSHGVIGLKRGETWAETYHDRSVAGSDPLYRYQLLSTWGQVFFPRHWNAFVDWAVEARNQTGFKPCVPYMVSNSWYLQAPEKIWSIWFNYFVYHSGLTNLYINFNHLSSKTNYALLINYRENGLHYLEKDNRTKEIVKNTAVYINPSMTIKLPPMNRIPVYNFFFRLVKNENLLQHQWRFTSNYADQCTLNNKTIPVN
jgi:hypothetical protein